MRRKGQQAENNKTERVTGLGRRTRKEIAKWNQMTALRFQTGGRHQTSPASLQGEGGEGGSKYKTAKEIKQWYTNSYLVDIKFLCLFYQARFDLLTCYNLPVKRQWKSKD